MQLNEHFDDDVDVESLQKLLKGEIDAPNEETNENVLDLEMKKEKGNE